MSDITARPASSSPLVERLIGPGQIEPFGAGTQESFAEAMRTLGYASVFDIIREPRESFARKLRGAWQEGDVHQAHLAYDNACCYAAQASLVYRQQRLSSGWVPSSGQRSGIRSLVDVGPSYPKLFKENWDAFCRSGALEAIDSPVAYLADIVRFAQALETHGNASKITLSQRRPDLFAPEGATTGGLMIDASTTFDDISALQVANEVVYAKIQHYLDSLPENERPAASIEAWCASRRYAFLFPYAAAVEQIRLGLQLPLGQLLYRGHPLPTPFSAVTHEAPTEAVGYAPIALTEMSRERQDVLLEVPVLENQVQITAWFNDNYGLAVGTVDAQELQPVRAFLKQTGLEGDALDELLARGKYRPAVSPNVLEATAVTPAVHGAVYVNNDGSGTAPLALSEPGDASDATPLRLLSTTVQRFVRLNKMVRMRRWLDIPFADLDALVTVAQQAGGANGASTLTQDTLRVLGAYRYFAGKRGAKAEPFAALFADMTPYSIAGKPGLFDRTFNDPPLLDSAFVIDDKPFDDSSDAAASRRTMLQVCGGLGMSPDEREYGRAVEYIKRAIGRELLRSLPEVSAFHRLAYAARLFGLSVGDYLDLLEMLGGEAAVDMSIRGTLVQETVPMTLTYSTSHMPCFVGLPVKPNTATLVGATSATFAVTPPLPTGLSLNASTGAITGTPTVATAVRWYNVRATAAEGQALGYVNISVEMALKYSTSAMKGTAGKPITPNIATLVGATAVDFKFDRNMPAGITLNPSTGEIAGTPIVASENWTYTVIATATEGSASASVSLEVTGEASEVMDSVTPTGTMKVARRGHAAVLIRRGGKPYVLVIGGNHVYGNSVERYDPVTGNWETAASTLGYRVDHTATVLPSGKVLVAGGSSNGGTAEIYDPEKDAWSAVGGLNHPRANHGAVVLNSKVYVFGGTSTNEETAGEFYDEVTQSWTKTSPLGHSFVLGAVIASYSGEAAYVIGGFGADDEPLAFMHKYDSKHDVWAELAPLPAPLGRVSAGIVSPADHIGVFGGVKQYSAAPDDAPWFMWYPSSDSWSERARMSEPTFEAHVIGHNALGMGHYLLVGGSSSAIQRISARDADSPEARISGRLNTARRDATVTVIDPIAGTVLVAGGRDAEDNFLTSAEIVTINPVWSGSRRKRDVAERAWRAEASTGDALDLLLRVDWIVDWLKANKKTVADLQTMLGPAPASPEDGADIEDMARRIHDGLPATRLTAEAIAALDLPPNDDGNQSIAWGEILDTFYDRGTGLVFEPDVTLATPAEWVLLDAITAALAAVNLDAEHKKVIAASLADVIGAARRAQCGLLEAELSHASGLSSDQVTLGLIWSGTTPEQMLAPLTATDTPVASWLADVANFRRYAKALIDTKLSAVALHTFLAKPAWFDAVAAVALSPLSYYLMHRYRAWLNTRAGSEDEVIRYLAVANAGPGGDDESVNRQRCAERLAPLLGWPADDVLRACATLPAGVATSISQIEWLLRLGELSDEAGVPASAALQLGMLNGESVADDWADAGTRVHSAVRARTGAMGTQAMDAALDESRRDALVSLYLDGVVPNDSTLIDQGLAGRLQTPNDLYEYLLLDTQVSQQVHTSRVASAIASVQQYINGILIGMEPGYAQWQPTLAGNEGQVWEVEEWRDQKSQYPLWAANQQLRYFPELYIDPTLRLGKSSYFDELEQEVNQNRIHIDTVRKAVLAYLNKFEEVANLTIVNGYATSDDFANATYYFVGKSRGKNTYYWRKVDMSQRPTAVGSEHKGDTLNPSAWSDWELIDLPVSEATVERTIRPVFFNERLYVTWVDWYANGLPAGDVPGESDTRPPQVRLSGIYKEYDGSWSAPQVYIDKVAPPTAVGGVAGPTTRDVVFSYAFHDVHALPSRMMVGVHAGAAIDSDDNAGHKDRYGMMWNARLDHSFKVEPAWPDTGTVEAAGATLGEDERYIRLASRQFAMPRGTGLTYIQFPIAGASIRLKRVEDAARSPWQGAHNNAIEGLQQASRVSYESETTDSGVAGYVVVTCRLKDAVSTYKAHHAIWSFVEDNLTLRVEVTHRDYPAYFEAPSSVRFSTSVPGNISSVTYPAFYSQEESWRYDQFMTYGDFKPDVSNNIVGAENGSVPSPLGFGAVHFASTDHNMILEKRPSLDHSYGPQSRYKLGVFYAPNKLISGSPEYLSVLDQTPMPPLDRLEAGTEITFRISTGKTLFPALGDWMHTSAGGFQIAYGIMEYKTDGTTLQSYDLKVSTIYLEDYLESIPKAPALSATTDARLGTAEYIDFQYSSIPYSDGSTSHPRPSIRMNTLFAKDLISRTNVALENLLSWDTQSLAEPVIPNGPSPATMDFKGANGKYFWELFFHLPFSIAHRFHSEQQFADSDRWLQFIFDPSYKGDPVGENLAGSVRRPYWLVRPLDWVNDPAPDLSEALRAPLDPDAQASAFPVHYRKAVYFLFIRNLMLRGDWSFRELTPDSLNEAKLWYVRALDLLGPRPDALLSDRWTPTYLSAILGSTNPPLRALAESMSQPDLVNVPAWERTLPALQSQTFRRDTFLRADDTAPNLFRVPFNHRLVELWDQLESRLHNLRHNLTIDGKPLQLPIFAPPLDPSALLASFAAGGTSRSAGRLGLTVVPHYRYQTLFARASVAVETLIQFGQTLLSYVERKEQAEFSELQQGQLWEISQFAIDLQTQMQDVEAANQLLLEASRRIAEGRKAYYEDRLEDGGVSVEEISAAALHMTGRVMEGGAAAAFLAAYCLKAIPNVFGLSNGGQDVEGPPEGVGKAIIGAASIAHGVAEALDRAAQYKRRKEEWELQRDQAGLEVEQIDEQIKVLAKQRIATATQRRQAERAREQAEEMYTFLSKRFSNSSLYAWLVSQLSTFYYQAYDATLSLCLAAEACWQFEIGDFAVRFVEPGKWKDSYRGLTVGEGLKLNLLKMDAAYVNRHERHLVIGKTISVRALYEQTHGAGWETKWNDDLEKGVLSFELTKALFDADYDNHTLRRIRRVGVSIPAVVGAYQDIRAVLTQTSNAFEMPNTEIRSNVRASQQIIVSRGVDDDGMMMDPQTMDDRYLPFEGTGAVSSWNLTFPNATTDPQQQATVKSLNDVILHLTYSARVSGSVMHPVLRLPPGRIGG